MEQDEEEADTMQGAARKDKDQDQDNTVWAIRRDSARAFHPPFGGHRHLLGPRTSDKVYSGMVRAAGIASRVSIDEMPSLHFCQPARRCAELQRCEARECDAGVSSSSGKHLERVLVPIYVTIYVTIYVVGQR